MGTRGDTGDFDGTQRFAIRARLGAGGMGVVYRAHDRERGADVALKTLHRAGGDAVLHLKHEFRALRDVAHPNLVSLGELIEDDGRWFFTMELVDGVDFVEHVRGVASPAAIAARSIATTASSIPTLDERERAASTRTMPAFDIARGSGPIEPPPPDPPVARGQLDEPRLRAALVQLARGLDTLHRAGKVHRDVKPSNVLVADDGRVVLLDFGLVVDQQHGAPGGPGPVVGTTAYMAPEQAAGEPVGPAADWYAVGTLLYEALTGDLPFGGPPFWMLIQKQDLEPPPASERQPDVPADLDELCSDLLRRDPAARPTGAEVLARLAAEPAPLAATVARAPLIGRDAELARLEAAFAASAAGPVAVTVRGDSGVGKSYLVRGFLDRLVERDRDVVVLAGRCYERESVPYKAFDGVIDALAAYLAGRPADELAALMPPRVGKLAQLFPVLRRVDAIAAAPRPAEAIDQPTVRARAFVALRELLGRIGARHRLVITIDDLPRTDADSLALLRELLRPPDAPRLLLITTSRVDPAAATAADDVRTGALTDALALTGHVEQLDLGPLTDEAATALVAALARPRLRLRRAQRQALADEARGHPLFIQELVQHAALGGAGHAPGPWRVDDAILARVARLDPEARGLLELIAVAGAPLPLPVLARAAGAPVADVARRVVTLRVVNLVRTDRVRAADVVLPYHDRVREALLADVAADRGRDLHARLALAHEAADHADAEALAFHWRGADQPARAIDHAIRAAGEAAAALAFRRAARLYQLALDLGVGPRARRRAHTIELGDALANAGAGGDAARAYLAAAHDAPPAQRADLERRATAQLLRAGYIDEGIEHARAALAGVGLPLPRDPRLVVLGAVAQRAHLRLRGLGFRERPAARCAPADLAAIDTCWSTINLSFVDAMIGANLAGRALRLALDVGEPGRLSRHLVIDGVYTAQFGRANTGHPDQMFALAEQLATRGDHAGALAWVEAGRGMLGLVRGQFTRGRDHFARAVDMFDGVLGVTWEVSLCRLQGLTCTAYHGDLPAVARQLGPLLADADERGDRFLSVSIGVVLSYLLALAGDRPALARRTIADSMARWSQRGFHTQHRHALVATAEVDLYEGDGGAAHRRLGAAWPTIERSGLLRVRRQRIESHFTRARAAIMAARAPGADIAACHATALTSAAVLDRDGFGWARAFGQLARAGVAGDRGHAEAAHAELVGALRSFDLLGMRLHAAIARRRLGELLGGTAGAAHRATADAWLTAAGVRNIPRLVALYAPGFDR